MPRRLRSWWRSARSQRASPSKRATSRSARSRSIRRTPMASSPTPTKVIGLIPGVTILAGPADLHQPPRHPRRSGGQFSILEPGETLAPIPRGRGGPSRSPFPDEPGRRRPRQPGRSRRHLRDRDRPRARRTCSTGPASTTDKSTKSPTRTSIVLAKTSSMYVVKVPARQRRGDRPPPGERRSDVQPRAAVARRRPATSTRAGSARRPTSSSSATACRSRRSTRPARGRPADAATDREAARRARRPSSAP